MFVFDGLLGLFMFAMWSFGIAFLIVDDVGAHPIISIGMIIIATVIYITRYFGRRRDGSYYGGISFRRRKSPFDDPDYLNK